MSDEATPAASADDGAAALLALLEALPEPILIRRADRYLFANSAWAALLGRPADTFVGRSLLDDLHPDERPRFAERFAQQQLLPPTRARVLRADGRAAELECTSVMTIDVPGGPGVIVRARDAAEQVRLQTHLAATERMVSLGTLASGMAHEINNPLSYILANVAFVASRVRRLGVPEEPAREIAQALEEARQGAERVRDIVRHLQAFSRSREERVRPLDVRKAMDQAVQIAGAEVRARARLLRDYDEVPPVLGSEARLTQVFVHLLLNAAHAIAEDRADRQEVRATVRRGRGGAVVVEVSDTGAGIAPDHMDRVFEPFFTTKQVGSGSGLGLYVCHGIVSAMGGEIAVESQVGRGTTFRLSFPPAGVGLPTPTGGYPIPGRRARVLVVDDDARVGSAVQRTLSSDHDVTAVTSAADARAAIERDGPFDVILCDLMMPEQTGMDLYEELARDLPEAAARMVFFSGGAYTPRARAFVERGDHVVLDKPFDTAVLQDIIRRAADGTSRGPDR